MYLIIARPAVHATHMYMYQVGLGPAVSRAKTATAAPHSMLAYANNMYSSSTAGHLNTAND